MVKDIGALNLVSYHLMNSSAANCNDSVMAWRAFLTVIHGQGCQLIPFSTTKIV